MVETTACIHCGALTKHPVYKEIGGQTLAFCCGGCIEVYEMLHEEDLEAGQGMPETIHSQPSALQPDPSGLPETITFHVEGMTCANCVATVTRQLNSVPGVITASVVLKTEFATVKTVPERVAMADLKRAVEKAGYRIL